MERPRRLSYAGLAKPPQQKSRRVSDAGQSGFAQHPGTTSSPNPHHHKDDPPSSTAMMHDSRYEPSNLNRRAERRTSRHSRGDDSFTCSQQSVLSAMDRFVKAVNNMDSTVLVPSRLQDMEVASNNDNKCLPAGLNNTDVFRFYVMLKDVKNELLWGPTSVVPAALPILSSSGRSSPSKTHVRQPSDDSLGGSTGFPSDQETDSDIESVVTDRDSMDDQSVQSASTTGNHLATAFRHHLLGLHTILHDLADSADYLSSRYQEEIEAPSS